MATMRVSLLLLLRLLLTLTTTCDAILPEIVNSGILLEDYTPRKELDSATARVEPEDQLQAADASHQGRNGSGGAEQVDDTAQEPGVIATATPHSTDLGNNIESFQGCVTSEDCVSDSFCSHDTQNFRCLPCKATDVSCAQDEECCGEQLCVWGQCSQNATKGEAGSTCQYQTDCSSDLCCAFHTALLFPVCSAKPIERERCVSTANRLMALLSWDAQEKGPRKHCPCVGGLRCQHLGRGSMCLKGEDSSEEELADTLYSEIDYVL